MEGMAKVVAPWNGREEEKRRIREGLELRRNQLQKLYHAVNLWALARNVSKWIQIVITLKLWISGNNCNCNSLGDPK
jgi:hypothetical protein